MEDKKVNFSRFNIISRFFKYCKQKFDSRTINNAKYYQDWSKIKWRYRSYKLLYLSLSFAAIHFLLYLKPKEKFEEDFTKINADIEKYFNTKETKLTFQENFNKLSETNKLFFNLTLIDQNTRNINESKEVKLITGIINHIIKYNNLKINTNNNVRIMKMENNPNFSQEEDDISENLYHSIK